jgi:nitrogen-specific signal transduction histidine kinase
VRVCSQGAKEVRSGRPALEELLASGRQVAALVAPSFPAEFPECDYRVVVGKLRRIGFARVCETAFGADLVAREYRRVLETRPDERFIATTCPAVVSFVAQYHPNLVDRLMPVVSPMVAAARTLRAMHPEQAIVFIGPCIAKKAEAAVAGSEVDAVLTFTELRVLLGDRGITPASVTASEFDPPRAGMGRLFALTRGLLETAGIREELVNNDVVASDGRDGFIGAIEEFEAGALNARLLEVLCCHGCIMGAGMSRRNVPLFKRRALISAYVRGRLADAAGTSAEPPCAVPDLGRTFVARDRRLSEPAAKDVNAILAAMGKTSNDDELNCGACGYPTCRDHAVAIREGLAEEEMCLPYTIEKLKETVKKLADSNEEVATIQYALAQSEKLASMGQLAAGVAHEVNNPLGIVLMYAHLLLEKHGVGDPALGRDLETIVAQADRCKRIISGLLDFARQNKVLRQRTDVVRLVEDNIRAVNLPPEIVVETKATVEDPSADVDSDQIAQVLVNLLTNAQAAMPRGGVLSVHVSGDADTVMLRIADTGIGIPPENLPRIFDPFFTTKQIGKGTGLGLAVVYGIVKMHRGRITVKSNADPAKGATGTTFTLVLPRREG